MLSEEDAALLDLVSLAPPADQSLNTGCDFIDNWNEWERTLRQNLAKRRSVKIKRDFPIEPVPYPQDAAAAAGKAANNAGHPLEGEITLDRARWSAVESLQGYDYFNRNVVFAYMLKLLLLERRQSFNIEEGFSEYKSLYASILENAQESVGEPK
jgi:hypothetical protein